MTNEQFLRDLKSVNRGLDNEISSILEHSKKLVAVAEFGKALKGDLDAKDEQPTHFCSWFNFIDAIENLERE